LHATKRAIWWLDIGCNYNRAKYRKRNAIEWLFRRLKGFRRVFSRFDRFDVMFTSLIHFVLRDTPLVLTGPGKDQNP
jgi:transposase